MRTFAQIMLAVATISAMSSAFAFPRSSDESYIQNNEETQEPVIATLIEEEMQQHEDLLDYCAALEERINSNDLSEPMGGEGRGDGQRELDEVAAYNRDCR